MINTQDEIFLRNKGISMGTVNKQLEQFKVGFPFLKVSRAASVDDGILKLNDSEVAHYQKVWNNYVINKHSIAKFVPASGAASRMFKDLFEFLDAPYDAPQTEFEIEFFDNIEQFSFYTTLNAVLLKYLYKDIPTLKKEGQYKDIVKYLLSEDGLNYGQLPKGLLLFHRYNEGVRTAVEEHLVEGAEYAKMHDNVVNLHFTVSGEHREFFENLLNKLVPKYADKYKVTYNISFSEQKSSTDTIAVDLKNEPFRVDGEILFRPGGHGALIENLNDLRSEVVFVKNIDNIVPDHLKPITRIYKQVIAGVLVEHQQQIFDYLDLLESGKYTHEQVLEVLQFVQKKLHCKNPETKDLDDSELVIYLIGKLNRPIRVCGMVENVGEPGGGPFFAYNNDGTVSLQILESSQINMENQDYLRMFKEGTHFNPVDLVCGLYNNKGDKFDLQKFVDPKTGFISSKSKNGDPLKALELPGLWNGAMSDWNTIFVEVPLATFNPVKTVNDLLRKEHQPEAVSK